MATPEAREYRLVPHLEYADVLEIATWDKGASSWWFRPGTPGSEKWPLIEHDYRTRAQECRGWCFVNSPEDGTEPGCGACELWFCTNSLSGEIPACQRGYPLFFATQKPCRGCDGRDWRTLWSESLDDIDPSFRDRSLSAINDTVDVQVVRHFISKTYGKQILLNHPVGLCDFDMVDHTRRLAIEFIDPSSSGEFDNMRLMYKTLLALHHGYRIMHVYLKHLGLINWRAKIHSEISSKKFSLMYISAVPEISGQEEFDNEFVNCVHKPFSEWLFEHGELMLN